MDAMEAFARLTVFECLFLSRYHSPPETAPRMDGGDVLVCDPGPIDGAGRHYWVETACAIISWG